MLNDQRPRRVVPRWRSSWVTATTSEAKPKKTASRPQEVVAKIANEVSAQAQEFAASESVPVASELMFLAATVGNIDLAKRAARAIIANSDQIGSRQLILTAQQVLEGGTREHVEASSRDFVRRARSLLAIDYANPVLLIDAARELTAMQQERAALRYVRAATALAPKSRFILRAAVRYYLHIGEHELAHSLLQRSPLLGGDPWIQAAEVAVSTVRGRTSPLVKRKSRSLAEAKNIEAELSELASAVATAELLSGENKRAKVLFKHALSNPNDNSLAQAEWAATTLKLVVDERALSIPMSFEANSHNSYRNMRIEEAIRQAVLWAEDEPFASRPLQAQCYLHSLEGHYDEALRSATKAVELDGNDLGQRLNLIFCQIQSGHFENLEGEFFRVMQHPDIKRFAVHYLANAGALAYAFGDFEKARNFYQLAIRAAQTRSDPQSEAIARAFFARIATAAGDPQAAAIAAEASSTVVRLPNPGAIYIVQSLVGAEKGKALERLALGRVARQNWHWDALTNTLRLIDQ